MKSAPIFFRQCVLLIVVILAVSRLAVPSRNLAALPPSGRIVFQSTRDTHDENKYQLYRINADGSNLVRLTNDAFDDWFPTVSPDGKSIAFQSDRTGDWALFMMNADGFDIIQRTHGMNVSYPAAWSPDGTKLAVTSQRDIYVMNVDGSNPVNLTHNPANDQRPAWSPDGKQIAFGSSRGFFNNIPHYYLDNQIFVMNSDGSAPTQLTHYGNSSTFPEWSPNGKWIAFALLDESIGGVYIMATDGSNVRKVSSFGFMTSWSPDSQYLAFVIYADTSQKLPTSALYVLNVASGQLTRLTDYDGDVSYPSWGM